MKIEWLNDETQEAIVTRGCSMPTARLVERKP